MSDNSNTEQDTTHLETCIARANEAMTHTMALYAIAAHALETAAPGVPIEGNQRFRWLSNFNGMGTVVEDDAVRTVDLESFPELILVEGEQNFRIRSIEVLRGIVSGYVTEFSPDIDVSPSPIPLSNIEVDADGTIRLVLHDALSSLAQNALWAKLEPLLLSDEPIDPTTLDLDVEQLALLMGDVGYIGLELDTAGNPIQRVPLNDDAVWQTALEMGGYADAVLMDDLVAQQLPLLREELAGFSPTSEYQKLDQITQIISGIPDNVCDISLVDAKRRFLDFEYTARIEVDSRAYLQTMLRAGTSTSEEWFFRDLLIRNYRSLNPIEIRHLVGMSTYDLSEFVYNELAKMVDYYKSDYVEQYYSNSAGYMQTSEGDYFGSLVNSYAAVRIARKERYDIVDPLDQSLEITLFLLSFIAGVGRYVDFYDALRLLARGDAAGALSVFLPEALMPAVDALRRMGSRVNNLAQSTINRVRSRGLNRTNSLENKPIIDIQPAEDASARFISTERNFAAMRIRRYTQIDLGDLEIATNTNQEIIDLHPDYEGNVYFYRLNLEHSRRLGAFIEAKETLRNQDLGGATMAINEIEINGEQHRFITISGDKIQNSLFIRPPQNRHYNTLEVPTYRGTDRPAETDAEYRAIEIIENRLQQIPNVNSGTVVIYVERQPCRSCTFVLGEFSLQHPQLDIIVFYEAEPVRATERRQRWMSILGR